MVSILGNYHFNFPSEIKLTKCCEDYLEDQVDERYFLKSQKAMDLIQELIDKGELDNDNALDRQTDRQTDRWLVDSSTNNPRSRTIANCITTREPAGIRKHAAEGNAIVE
jgi:hypothetical protein